MDNKTRKIINGTAMLTEQNRGTSPELAKCSCKACTNALGNEKIFFQMPSQPNGIYFCRKCLRNHDLLVREYGSNSKVSDFSVSFTIANNEIDALAYGCQFPYLAYTNKGIHVLVTSATFTSNNAIIKVLNGLNAFGLDRKITISFKECYVVCKVSNANDVIRATQSLLSVNYGTKAYNKHLETLKDLKAIIKFN